LLPFQAEPYNLTSKTRYGNLIKRPDDMTAEELVDLAAARAKRTIKQMGLDVADISISIGVK
jgi:hypothetical protein